MAPKAKTVEKSQNPPQSSNGMFYGMTVFLVDNGVQARRLQIWKQKLEQMGALIEDKFSKRITHIFAADSESVKKKVGTKAVECFKGKILVYQWLEDSLKLGEKVSENLYVLREEPIGEGASCHSPSNLPRHSIEENPENNQQPCHKKIRSSSPGDLINSAVDSWDAAASDSRNNMLAKSHNESSSSLVTLNTAPDAAEPCDMHASYLHPYNPPDLNKNVTEIFKRLVDIYRALGDDRRSYSYYKAIPVIEKLTFKIESTDQIKHLPAIGKSLQDHIMEIVNTGKLSKLDHFEQDEKVRTISLFGEVWGIGPATALKLYEKGHRTLEDLMDEPSLTTSQKLGLKYFDDIKTKIPCHEVKEMEKLLKKAAENVLPGVLVVCGGSYRRGKSFCGDMDIIITHPDGQSHRGFLSKYVKYLKELNFVKEDLVFSTHSEEGTHSGVDTYFGLCTYPGREVRHRIDFKVYPHDIYAFGLIAWTGNDTLNRRLRLLAESKGYRLDDIGLFPASHGSSSKQGVRATASLHFKTEKEVFDFLGFPWLEPHERNI